MTSWRLLALGAIAMVLAACEHGPRLTPTPTSSPLPVVEAGPIGPRVDVEESEIDLGTFDEFASPVAVIVFRNTGDETLELSGPSIPGSHYAGIETLLIEPMGRRPVELELSFWDLPRGVFERRASWRTNDPRQPVVHAIIEIRVGQGDAVVAKGR